MGLFERLAISVFFVGLVFLSPSLRRWYKTKTYSRGRKLIKQSNRIVGDSKNGLRWGNQWIPMSAAVQHFLAVGTTGSGKSLIQKLLLKEPLSQIQNGSDSRAVIFDAKNDIARYLRQINVSCPVYSLNPFESSKQFPIAVAWDIAKDITSPARALNLACSLIPQEKGGNNQYFTDAARQVLVGVIESFIRHSPETWTFTDLVIVCLSQSRIKCLLARDANGREVAESFFGDDRTGYQVFTTICSKMSSFKTVAALWQRNPRKLSIRDWLKSDSILLLGANATVKKSLDAINEQIFRVMVEEIDIQANSVSRRTWVWIDEARLSGPLLKGDLLPFLAVKGRSRGVAIVIAFQDIEGLREAAGVRIANELVAQFSNKALLRMESNECASWAAKQFGQFETIEYFTNHSQLNEAVSAQRTLRDSVLPSQFLSLAPTSREHGLNGYFITTQNGATRTTVVGSELQRVADVLDMNNTAQSLQFEEDQWLLSWQHEDYVRINFTNLGQPPKRNGVLRHDVESNEFNIEIGCGHGRCGIVQRKLQLLAQ